MITLLKAFRVDENTVNVMYFHNELKYKFVVEWSNIHPGTGSIIDYDLQLECLSTSERFNERVSSAISSGETESNTDIDLYLAIRDTFDMLDCEDCE